MAPPNREKDKQKKKFDDFVWSFTRILRHSAPKHSLKVHPGGYVLLHEILDHPGLMLSFTTEEVKTYVQTIEDQIFELKLDETNKWLIRAKSGQTFGFVPLRSEDSTATDITTLTTKLDTLSIGDKKNVPVPVQDGEQPPNTTSSRLDKIHLSKTLFWLLKTGVQTRGYELTADGYIDIDKILVMPQVESQDVGLDDILDIVSSDQRFEIQRNPETQKLQIRVPPMITRNLRDSSRGIYMRLEPSNPPLTRLHEILRFDAPRLGLKLYPWGFINIDDILKLNCKEFDGMTLETMIESIKGWNDAIGDHRSAHYFMFRRDPNDPAEIQVRVRKGQTYESPAGDGFNPQAPVDKVKLSKTLSYLLRHRAVMEVRDQYGFVEMDWLMCQYIMKYFTVDQVVDHVEKPDGIVRFQIITSNATGKLEIRATYGHSVEVCSVENIPILNADEFPTIVYGTNFECWEEIKETGIGLTSLTHIHCAADLDYLLRHRFIFYSRYELLDVVIYIDLKKALEDGFKFFVSDNDKVICRGVHVGRLDPIYFSRVVTVATGENLPF